ncbi:MAG: M4 family metallopeptidase [Microbacteriaceae bacterium]|nr:M4 family metallopeptidase [Microbacteriaceae bacterium]
MRHTIVPPYLLRRLTTLEDPAMAHVAQAALQSLAMDESIRRHRAVAVEHGAQRGARRLGPPARSIFDAEQTETVPGTLVRSEGEDPGPDIAVDEAYDGFGHTHALFRQVYGRASIDDDNLPLLGTVHFGRDYENAFWDGERMVFGDGDGMVFGRFTASLSVIGHELAHGVTQYTANLIYRGQSGALNESISDVFGALVEQRVLGHTAESASWIIGTGLFTDRVEGLGLRSMKAPGTAYDDDVLGKDPQPASMEDYIDTVDDNGGVHLNSGIPNRAFYLAATAIGGEAWSSAGQIWYDTVSGGTISASCDFAAFARATAGAAADRFGVDSIEHVAVTGAWAAVGVGM